MYYLQSRYYDPEIKRFICADDTKVLQEQMDLYNKNLYVYCDNNPIIKKDATGEVGFWSVAIGAVTNIAVSGLTAVLTGGEYTAKDAVKDGIAGALGTINRIEKYVTFIFAGISGVATATQLWKDGESLGKSVVCGFLDGVSSAINLSNAANLTIKPNKLPEDLAINMTNEIFGFGTGLVVGNVNNIISADIPTGNSYAAKKTPKPQRVTPKNYYYDPMLSAIENAIRMDLIW